ncbi:hypothetical protein LPJ71_002933, partial [Coemansia sp. S17]
MTSFACSIQPDVKANTIVLAMMANLASPTDTWLQSKLDADGKWGDKEMGFVAAIFMAYTPHADAAHAELELPFVHQASSVSKYTDCLQAVMGHIPNMADAEMCHCFMVGLKDSLKQKVMDSKAALFDVAKPIALSSDVFASKVHIRSAPATLHPTPVADSNAMDVNTLHALCFPHMSTDEHAYAMAAHLCFKCKQPGHISHNCPMGCKPSQGHSYHQQHVHAMNVPTIPAPGYPPYYQPYYLPQVIYPP